MTAFDWGVLAVIALSAVLGIARGLVRELFALVGWIVAGAVGVLYATPVGDAVARIAPELGLGVQPRWAFGFLIVFLAVLIGAGFVALALGKLMRIAGLAMSDRVLGGVFGVARGLVILVVAVMLAGLTPIPQEPFWAEARLARPLEALATATKPWLPDAVAARLAFH